MPNVLIEPKPNATQIQERGEGKQPILPTIKQIQIPLTGAPWAIVQVPVPMTIENWKELEDFLALMKGPITGTRKQT